MSLLLPNNALLTLNTILGTIGRWSGVAVSNDGQYYLIGEYTSQKVYMSTDGAASWNEVSGLIFSSIYYESVIKISNNGQYMLISTQQMVYLSTDYGVNWANIISLAGVGGSGYGSIACKISEGGQYMAVITYYGSSYYYAHSSDYGANWNKTALGYFPTHHIGMSDNGQYVLIGQIQSLNSYRYLKKSTNYGVSFTTVSGAPTNNSWRCHSVSNTGQYMVASDLNYLCYSTNYGVAWTFDINKGCSSSSISDNGQYQLAAERYGNLYQSSNYGVTWTILNFISDPDYSENYWQCRVSSSGQYQMIAAYSSDGIGKVYWSSDYGANWAIKVTGFNIYAIDMSPDGQFAISGTTYNSDGYVYGTSDYGANWNKLY